MQGNPASGVNLESMVIPTEFPTANPISHTDAEVPQKLTKLCSNAGFSKNIDNGQFYMTLDEEGPDDMKTSCRQYTVPRSKETSRVRGWIRGNTKIGPVLDVKVGYQQGRYGVEIMIESLF